MNNFISLIMIMEFLLLLINELNILDRQVKMPSKMPSLANFVRLNVKFVTIGLLL